MAPRRDSRILPPLITLVVLLLASVIPEALPGQIASDRNTRELEVLRADGLGPLRIPFYQPVSDHPTLLAELSALAKEGAYHRFRDRLLEALSERKGRLLRGSKVFEGPVREIQDPAELLRAWATTIPAGAFDGYLERLMALPIDDAHPLLWLPGVDDAAIQRLEEAIEAGDRAGAQRLMTRPNIAESIDERLRLWLMAPPPETLASPARVPERTLEALAEGSLVKIARTGLSHRGARSDRGLGAAGKASVRRRHPAPAVRPLILDQLLLVPDGSGLVAHRLDGELSVAWRWQAPIADTAVRRPPLTIIGDTPIAGAGRIALLTRTPREEYHPASNAIHDPTQWKDWGWNQLWILDGIASGALPGPGWSPQLAREGFTFAAEMKMRGDRLYLVASRGWKVVESWVFAIDLGERREAWRRQICSVPHKSHSLNDLRGKMVSAQLAIVGNDLWACAGNGLIARLDLADGAYRGALLYHRYDDERLPSQGGILWSRNRFTIYPALRQRFQSPVMVDEEESRMVLLPADSRDLLAIDLEKRSISWRHPLPAEASLFGSIEGHPLIIDGINDGDDRLRLWQVDDRTGETALPGVITISLPLPRPRPGDSLTTTDHRRSPLLSGVPLLSASTVWIPSLESLILLDWPGGSDTVSRRELPWPPGSGGGTPWPLNRSQLAVIARGDESLGTVAGIDLLSLEKVDGDEEEKP